MFKYIVLTASIVLISACTPVNAPVKSTSGEANVVMIAVPTSGSGNHTIEYFGDFQCPACIRFSHTLLPVLEEYADSGKLTIVYKQFPLTNIHKNAYRDSLAGLCAAEQGKYMSYKKSLIVLEESKVGAAVSDSERVDATKDTGIDSAKFSECLSTDKYKASVDRDMKEGNDKSVNATPTLILDGTKLDLSIFRDENMFREQMSRILAS